MAELAIQHRMAAMGVPVTADSGVLMAYGHDAAAIIRRGAGLVDRILRGTKPAGIPLEQPNVHELVVNLRTARALGVELPRSLICRSPEQSIDKVARYAHSADVGLTAGSVARRLAA
jgi:putative tryptophan/tyrosine transport system substrate-binding protein